MIGEHFLKSMSRGKKNNQNTSTCTFDWLTLNMYQVQVAALHVWPQPQRHCRGFVQNELPVQKSIKCHQDLSCTWQIKVAGSADALLRCTADANRQSVTVGSSVTDEKNSAEQSGYFHILRLKCQSHVQTSVSPAGRATAEAAQAQLTANRWMNELEKHWAPGSSCVRTSITMLYGSLSAGQRDQCDAG